MSTQPTQLPEGAKLVGFKYSAMGMYLSPYWSIRQVDGGYACAETRGEIYWPAIDGEDGLYGIGYDEEKGYGYEQYSSIGDPLAEDGPMHSLTLLTDDDMAELQRILEEHGVLAWDGFDEAWYPPKGVEVTDTGATFDLKLLFSDGTVMKAHGVDAYPEGYNDALVAIGKFFEEHTDYSAYYPKAFPQVEANKLTVSFAPSLYSSGATRYSIELTRSWKRWIIALEDPRGTLLPAGTNISEYGDTDDALPFERFMGIISEYGLESWNQADEIDNDGPREVCTMRISFDNGQYYEVSTNVYPENYEAFKAAMVAEIAAYYDEVHA